MFLSILKICSYTRTTNPHLPTHMPFMAPSSFTGIHWALLEAVTAVALASGVDWLGHVVPEISWYLMPQMWNTHIYIYILYIYKHIFRLLKSWSAFKPSSAWRNLDVNPTNLCAHPVPMFWDKLHSIINCDICARGHTSWDSPPALWVF